MRDDNEREELLETVRARIVEDLNLDVYDIDFSRPGSEGVRMLRCILRDAGPNALRLMSADCGIDRDALDRFIESGDTSMGYIRDNAELVRRIGEAVQSDPFLGREPDRVETVKVVRTSFGGTDIEFVTDMDGRLLSATAHRLDGMDDVALDIPRAAAGKLWFRCAEIAAGRKAAGLKPGM